MHSQVEADGPLTTRTRYPQPSWWLPLLVAIPGQTQPPKGALQGGVPPPLSRPPPLVDHPPLPCRVARSIQGGGKGAAWRGMRVQTHYLSRCSILPPCLLYSQSCFCLPPHWRNRQGFRIWGAGCRVSVFGFRVSVFGFRVSGFSFRVSGFGFRISGSGFWVWCSGRRVQCERNRDPSRTTTPAGGRSL